MTDQSGFVETLNRKRYLYQSSPNVAATKLPATPCPCNPELIADCCNNRIARGINTDCNTTNRSTVLAQKDRLPKPIPLSSVELQVK